MSSCVMCGAYAVEGEQICIACARYGGPWRHSVLVFDPGESTGWVCRSDTGKLEGGTAPKDHEKVAQLISIFDPNVVVVERFNLFPGRASSLAWNSFYPCEVIGVIRYICQVRGTPLVEQAPGVKKYFGGFKGDWEQLKAQCTGVTEHTKDAYMHYRYFLRNGIEKRKESLF